MDYLLFGLFFFTGFVILLFDPIASITNELIFYQIHHVAIDTAYLILILHALRTRWPNPPFLFFAIGILWYILLFTLTLLCQIMPQPEAAMVIFLELPHSFSTYWPLGAGLELENGIIIYSTAFRYIGELYRIFSLVLLIFAYLTFHPYDKSLEVGRGKRLWLIVWLFLLLHAISMFPWLNITEIVSLFLLIDGALLAYILIRMPEYLIISHSQFMRFHKLYETFENQRIALEKWFIRDDKSFGDFLKAIEEKKRKNNQ
jgi:hypothetical protein